MRGAFTVHGYGRSTIHLDTTCLSLAFYGRAWLRAIAWLPPAAAARRRRAVPTRRRGACLASAAAAGRAGCLPTESTASILPQATAGLSLGAPLSGKIGLRIPHRRGLSANSRGGTAAGAPLGITAGASLGITAGASFGITLGGELSESISRGGRGGGLSFGRWGPSPARASGRDRLAHLQGGPPGLMHYNTARHGTRYTCRAGHVGASPLPTHVHIVRTVRCLKEGVHAQGRLRVSSRVSCKPVPVKVIAYYTVLYNTTTQSTCRLSPSARSRLSAMREEE